MLPLGSCHGTGVAQAAGRRMTAGGGLRLFTLGLWLEKDVVLLVHFKELSGQQRTVVRHPAGSKRRVILLQLVPRICLWPWLHPDSGSHALLTPWSGLLELCPGSPVGSGRRELLQELNSCQQPLRRSKCMREECAGAAPSSSSSSPSQEACLLWFLVSCSIFQDEPWGSVCLRGWWLQRAWQKHPSGPGTAFPEALVAAGSWLGLWAPRIPGHHKQSWMSSLGQHRRSRCSESPEIWLGQGGTLLALLSSPVDGAGPRQNLRDVEPNLLLLRTGTRTSLLGTE